MFSFDNPRGLIMKGKTVVITGAASGIGKASVDVFTQMGANVIAGDINEEALGKLKEEFPDQADLIYPFKVNTADCANVEAMIDYAVETCGRMDAIFNNAGIMDGMLPITELTDEMWDRVMQINTNGVMYACRKAVRYYIENNIKGVIVNTASLGGLYGGRAGLAYTASKHAVVGITKNIAYMYGDLGIRCNAICPGAVATNIGMGMKMPSERGAKRMALGMPLSDRVGDPYELAQAALFLTTDGASFVNGITLTIDGGWSAY